MEQEGFEMTWLEKDIEDLLELQTVWCREHDCQDCGFNTNANSPCLEQVVNSLGFTLESIKKAKRRLEEYV